MGPDFSLFSLFLSASVGPEAELVCPPSAALPHGALCQQPGQLPQPHPGWAQGLDTALQSRPSHRSCRLHPLRHCRPDSLLPCPLLAGRHPECLPARGLRLLSARMLSHSCFLQAPCMATCVLADSFASVPFSISLTGACHLSVQPLSKKSFELPPKHSPHGVGSLPFLS